MARSRFANVMSYVLTSPQTMLTTRRSCMISPAKMPLAVLFIHLCLGPSFSPGSLVLASHLGASDSIPPHDYSVNETGFCSREFFFAFPLLVIIPPLLATLYHRLTPLPRYTMPQIRQHRITSPVSEV
jgi:hypothetical protein